MDFQYSQIKEAIKENKLVFFVGAGLSAQENFPTWRELCIYIITTLHARYPADKNLSAQMKILTTAFDVFNTLNEITPIYHQECLEIMAAKISSINFSQLKYQNYICKISDQIITTNYDLAFEEALKKLHYTNVTKFIYNNNADIAQLEFNKSYLFKLHGCVTDQSHCLLFKEQYKQLYNFKSGSIYKLFSILDDSTIIFIGFSLSDPYFKSLLELRKKVYGKFQKTHFIITTQTLNFEKYGIQTIKLSNYDNDLERFFNALMEIRLEYPFMLSSYISAKKRNGKAVDDERLKRDYKLLEDFRAHLNYDYNVSVDFNNFQTSERQILEILMTLYAELKYIENLEFTKADNHWELSEKIAKFHFDLHLLYKLYYKFDDAKEQLNKAIKNSTATQRCDYIFEFGNLHLDTDDFKTAIKIYNDLLIEKLNDSQKMKVLSALGLAYRRNSQLEDALAVLKACDALTDESSQFDVLTKTNNKINYAAILITINHYSEAHHVLESCNVEELTNLLLTTKAPEYAIYLQCYYIALADLLLLTENSNFAMEIIEIAIQIGLQYKVATLETNQIFSSLAGAHFSLGNFDEALKVFEDQNEYYKKVVGEAHHLTLNIQFEIIRCLIAKGENEEAKNRSFELLNIVQLNLGIGHDLTGKCHGTIGQILKELGNNKKAISHYNKAISIFNLDRDNNILNLIVTYTHMASVEHLEHNRICIEHLLMVLQLYDENPNLKNGHYYQSVFDLAYYYQWDSKFELAMEYIISNISEMRSNLLMNEKQEKELLSSLIPQWGKMNFRVSMEQILKGKNQERTLKKYLR